eukprot:GEMP01010397.1.p1 GENE.GEMP01010397.1~~GEMP01010397.1.p1  ORF type:complete len:499 (+),score=77.68 GEMP01010397.1:154-1650(+)
MLKNLQQRPGISRARIIRNCTVYERYTVERGVLGNGLSGVVRTVVNKQTGRKAAMKSLRIENMSQKKWDMLYNEVEIYLQMDHPHICRLLEVYEDETAVHLIMELCSGKELYDRLASKKRYSEFDAVVAVLQMFAALQFMHDHHMCHRDLKLENWVYADESEDAKLKLIDFGFSKVFSAGIPMTAMHGTVYYVAPEVLKGCYDYKCDIWSTGVIVYMLLSGSPPFNGQNDSQIISKIKKGVFTYSGQRWAGISEDAKGFISSLLQHTSSDRPTAEVAIQHRWLKRLKPKTEDEAIDVSVLDNIRDFSSSNVMKRAALNLMALSLTSYELESLESQFKALDKTGRGVICMTDLRKAMKEHLGMNDNESSKVFKHLSGQENAEIFYSEFLAAAMQSRFQMQEYMMREAFQKFDQANTGKITVDNLRDVLGDEFDGTPVEDIIKQIDSTGKGEINYEAFCKALVESSSSTDAGVKKGGGVAKSVVRTLTKQVKELSIGKST